MTSDDAESLGTGRPPAEGNPRTAADGEPHALVLDQSILAVISQQIGSERVTELLLQALDDVDATSLRLRNETLSSKEVELIAHRLKGTALAFGLIEVGALAARIELLARKNEPSLHICDDLVAASGRARRAVDRESLLGG